MLKQAAQCGIPPCWPCCCGALGLAQNNMVRLQTSQGIIDIQLYDTAAPKTVANFLGYVRRGDYVNSFVHRSIPGFVIQGGGYVGANAASSIVHVPQQAAVPNEFSAARSNQRGTIATAESWAATRTAPPSEWFVNLVDNANPLDVDSRGYGVRQGHHQRHGGGGSHRRPETAYANATFSRSAVLQLRQRLVEAENLVRVTSATVLPAARP